MARNRDPFTQALTALRDRIQSGALAGGAPVIVQDEAARLRLSTTPVREALARLSGEGLVERATSGGYVTRRLDAAAARDRYAMREQYLRIALDLNQSALGGLKPPAPRFDAEDPLAAVERLFTLLVCSAGNQVLAEAFGRVCGQLSRFQAVEARLFRDLADEASDLYRTYGEAPAPDVWAAIARYHDRRLAAAGPLAALVWSTGSTSSDEATEADR